MFRRNPDAIAMVVFGFFMLAVNVPRILIRDSHWEVTPLRMEMQAQREQVKMVKEELSAHRDQFRAAAQQIRAAIHR